MILEDLILCEGVAVDNRGALTAVALSQTFIVLPELGEELRFVALVEVSDADGDSSDEMTVEVRVLNPDRSVQLGGFLRPVPPFDDKLYPEYPAATFVGGELEFTPAEYGEHTVEAILRVNDDDTRMSRRVYVVAPVEAFD